MQKKPQTLDSEHREDSESPTRFYLRRVKDETGISATGRVGEGVIWQNGWVSFQWRPPMQSMGTYPDLDTFMKIHVLSHPSCNQVDEDDLSDDYREAQAAYGEAVDLDYEVGQ